MVRAVEADRSAYRAPSRRGAPRARRARRRSTPGSAGQADDWLGKHGEHDGIRDVPPLWRIGSGRLGTAGTPFEVAVPLLDESHLQISVHPKARATGARRWWRTC